MKICPAMVLLLLLGGTAKAEPATIRVPWPVDRACVATLKTLAKFTVIPSDVQGWLRACSERALPDESCLATTRVPDARCVTSARDATAATTDMSTFADDCQTVVCEMPRRTRSYASRVDVRCVEKQVNESSMTRTTAAVLEVVNGCRSTPVVTEGECAPVQVHHEAACIATVGHLTAQTLLEEDLEAIVKACATVVQRCRVED